MAVPTHLGIIMDGNRRWARAHGLPAFVGHRRGARRLQPVLDACYAWGVQVVSVYALSTDNRHHRDPAEVRLLLDLIRGEGERLVRRLERDGVRFVHSGAREGLPPDTRAFFEEAEDRTRTHGPRVFNLAFNYGGRAELARACRTLLQSGAAGQAIDEASLEARLFTAGLPDMDLVLRTGGDSRLSNFFPWQSAKARLYITPTYWPALSVRQVQQALFNPAAAQAV